MSLKHMIDGLMQSLQAPNHYRLSAMTGLDSATISRIISGATTDMKISTISDIEDRSGVPVDTLFAWYRLPDEAVLGRISSTSRESAQRSTH